MPRRIMALAMLGAALVLSSCAPLTIDPVVTPNHSKTDDRILGTWTDANDSTAAIVTAESLGVYRIDLTSPEGHVELFANLGRLGSRTVVDLEPDLSNLDNLMGDFVIPGHMLGVLEIQADSIVVRLLDSERFERAARAGRFPLYLSSAPGTPIVQGSTRQLREAFSAYLKPDSVLAGKVVFRREGDADRR